jgi:hypothetical protein
METPISAISLYILVLGSLSLALGRKKREPYPTEDCLDGGRELIAAAPTHFVGNQYPSP